MNEPGEFSTVWTWVQFLVWVGIFQQSHLTSSGAQLTFYPVAITGKAARARWSAAVKNAWSYTSIKGLYLLGYTLCSLMKVNRVQAADRTLLAAHFMLVSCLAYSSTLKMETFSSEIYAFIRLHIVISQMSRLFIAISARTSNQKYTFHPLSFNSVLFN
jgi:hypothetical protein